MSTKHTPGPWTAEKTTVWGGEGARLTVADTTCCGSLTRDEDCANARLIAAAPDLLAALRGVLEWYAGLPEPGSVPGGVELGARLREAREAIAKVEGRLGARS